MPLKLIDGHKQHVHGSATTATQIWPCSSNILTIGLQGPERYQEVVQPKSLPHPTNLITVPLTA